MNVMTLISALAMIAATHSIATRVVAQPVGDGPVQTMQIHDLPGVRVIATLEPELTPLSSTAVVSSTEPERVFDLPAVRVYPSHDQVMQYRLARSRTALAVPGARTRRGASPQRTLASQSSSERAGDERRDRWQAVACIARMRLSRVWPVSRCDIADNARSAARVGMMLAGQPAPVRRR
ncbi:hypothetical protein MNR01_16740 [Lysobacter sp. S4-A87]|uniref:hypothetical protein n=1 Tax=Lysobacter sp. S4-A87 TaxID=2925843 RepID=UPI001F53DE25|nr:hypothetical protein [Lysobacter sp. S4-A87]UNK49348.1 hypothetical protein MNR01_16740 [Lysobacter sp. S4-A87]